MPAISITGFDGEYPRVSATMLGDRQAQSAIDVKLYAGELRYWRGPRLEYTPATPAVQTIYRVTNTTLNAYRWMVWADDVDVAPGPVSDAVEEKRLYMTTTAGPRKTNWALLSSGGGPYPTATLAMGVPAPVAAPTLTGIAGTSVAETRAYVYTYVSTFGTVLEESAPSPAATITLTATQGVRINGLSAAPTVGYNITAVRIYRSVSTSNGGDYAFVAQIPIATTFYDDTLLVTQLGSTLSTLGWLPPPAGLKGLVSMHGGVLAGFVGNTVYFSVPYNPHAWPIANALSFPHRVIGLGPFGQSMAVMTDQYPHVITGPYPGAYSPEKLEILEPCVSKRSIAFSEKGVFYASPNGLISIGSTTVPGITTRSLFLRDEWQAEAPASFAGVFFDRKYIAVRPGVKAMVLSDDDVPALSRHSISGGAAFVDANNAKLYFLGDDNIIYEDDATELVPNKFVWKSKRFVLPVPTAFTVMSLDADYGAITSNADYNALVAATVAQNIALFALPMKGEVNASTANSFALNAGTLLAVPSISDTRQVQATVYADGAAAFSVTFTSLGVVRLPAFKPRTIEIVLTGNISVRGIKMATSVAEMHE
jgi:hypothetical protein